MKTKVLFFAGIIFVSLNSLAQSGGKILLNKTYTVKVIEDYNTPDSNTWKDKIIFKNNKLYFNVFLEIGASLMPLVPFQLIPTPTLQLLHLK